MTQKNNLFENLDELSKIYNEARDQYDVDAENYWNSLSYEDKLKAFYIVTKRIHKGDIVDNGSFRHVLYDVFGFDMDSYIIGMDSGYMAIHNSIVVDDDDRQTA
jgi:hypothetical protein